MSNQCDVIGFTFRLKNGKTRIFRLRKPIRRRDAIRFIFDMHIKGYARRELSHANLTNGWIV